MNTIITMHELNGLTDQELGELHQLLTLLLTEADPNTQERSNIFASLENIERALGRKSNLIAPSKVTLAKTSKPLYNI